MATANYMDGRVEYRRPQALIFADNPGDLQSQWTATGKTASLALGSTTVYVANGISDILVGQTVERTSGTGSFGTAPTVVSVSESTSTITLSVAHTAAGSVTFRTGSTSFVPQGDEFDNFIIVSDHNRSTLDLTPERIEKRERMINGRMRSYHVADKTKITVSWSNLPSRAFAENPAFNSSGVSTKEKYTVDGGAGGNDLLKWYEEHVGSFWVYLAYDKYTAFGTDNPAYGHMHQYNQVLEMYMADFSHKVSKRGGLFDFWDVSITLEEA
jgi:hypothetical protein